MAAILVSMLLFYIAKCIASAVAVWNLILNNICISNFSFYRSDIIHFTSWLPSFLGWRPASTLCTNKGGRIRCESHVGIALHAYPCFPYLKFMLRNIFVYYIIRFTSLCKIFTYLSFFCRSHSVPCAPFSMLGGPSGTGYYEVRFPVHGDWGSRDVSAAGMCDCVKECMSFVM